MPTKPERLYCTHCQRPLRTCLCPWVTPLTNLTEVVILQHPLETHNAKNTARLLHMSLHNSETFEGEQFADDFLATLLNRESKTNLLLYPPTPAEDSLQLLAPASLPSLPPPEQLRLIVIDGTWRKSRKMLYLNPPLQGLPRVSLAD